MLAKFSGLMKNVLLISALFTLMISCSENVKPRILVFSKTAGYRHASIETGVETIKQIGVRNGYEVTATEDATEINEENLKSYHAVVFMSTTMDILNKQQQNDFERFIQAGGGFVGVHAATDTEYDWPWYNGLVGAYFESHPQNSNVRTAEFYTHDANHISMDSIPDRFEKTDEFYSFKSIQPHINVLLKIDESTYEGGTNGDDHPMSWYHEYDGGKSFYTAMGHTEETYAEPIFLKHLTGGIKYVLGGDQLVVLNYAKAKTIRVPDENRFVKVVLDENLDEPVELVVMSDKRVLFIERKGKVKLYDPKKKKTEVIYELPVSHVYKNADSGRSEAEDGLMGLALDPNFDKNGWVYMFHSLAGEKPVNVLTRWDFKDDKLVEGSMKIMLEVVVQREQCCHTGGSIAFDAQGNLYLSTGDNTSPRSTRYAPIDERPGRFPWDAQKGSGSTNDLRGKIIRITPEADGTYSIPEGNLFPVGTEKTRPEIYGMGMRNPYRISVDQKTGYVYWGDVGPDASKDSVGLGPNGYDEVNQLREPGFFGWPYFVGNNQAYYDFNFATMKPGKQFDVNKPINNSPNNTGLNELPPAQSAFIYYPYGKSEEFPELGEGGRTAMAGPVYYKDMFEGSARPFPKYYDGKLFIYEWIRGWIIAVTMDENGDYVSMERFMPSYKFSNPMDMTFGPDGDMYMLEYGTGWFQQNENARLIRVEYNDGNRKPIIEASASKTRGAIPMPVDFSAEGTFDFDRDELKYNWRIVANTGSVIAEFNDEKASYTFENVGAYTAKLTVTDAKGEKSIKEINVVTGNEPPEVSLAVVSGNSSYFFPDKKFGYKATVSDLEDGSTADGSIAGDEVSVTVDFLKEGFDKVEAVQGHLAADEVISFAAGKKLIEGSDCMACHKIDAKSVGPMYIDVAKKYKDDRNAGDYLIKKIMTGGNGVWGETSMSAHPGLAIDDVSKMVSYIMSLGDEQESTSLPIEGEYVVNKADVVPGQGTVILRASYADKGANGMASVKNEKVLILNSPTILAGDATFEQGVNRFNYNKMDLVIGQKDGDAMGYDAIDLTDVKSMAFSVLATAQYSKGGYIEIRADKLDSEVIGTSKFIKPVQSGQNMINVSVDVKPMEGVHALYITYKNDDKSEDKSLFALVTITLKAD